MQIKTNILKCHGSANDFIIVDEMQTALQVNEHERSTFTVNICDRRRGVGSDGILFIQNSEIAPCRMRMFNPDGSEAEMCGNGIRCVGRYVCEKLGLEKVRVETMKEVLLVERVPQISPGVHTFRTQIGPISQEPSSLPMTLEAPILNESIKELSSELKFSAISVPNPHLITCISSVEASEVKRIGELANQMKNLFPKGINVSFFQVIGKDKIFSMTFERGVGITQACGTAMTSCALIAKKLGACTGHNIEVYNLGGKVECELSDHPVFPASLAGNATFTFAANVEVNIDSEAPVKSFQEKPMLEEVDSYASFENNMKDEVEKLINQQMLSK